MTTYHIPDMSCGHCKATVEKTIHGLDSAARIEFDMAARKITVESGIDTARMTTALAEAGYPASPA